MAKSTMNSEKGSGRRPEPIDAIDLLASQHRAIEHLFDQLGDGPDGAPFRRTFLELADILALHGAIEERHFYPAVRAADTERELAEFVEDHLQIKRVLATLLETSQSDQDVMSEIEELEGLFEDHVLEEERLLFPKVRLLLEADQLIGLAQEMAAAMVELQRHGEPRGHLPDETERPATL
jgi:hemerythrin superfamily protein